jgi:hypothetical protein
MHVRGFLNTVEGSIRVSGVIWLAGEFHEPLIWILAVKVYR